MREAKLDISSVLDRFDKITVNASSGASIVVVPPNFEEGHPVKVLQPHSETNASLRINTRGWIFFKPTRLRLKSEIRYRIVGDQTEYTQVVPLNFDVRPPIRSVLVGAIAGAILGGLARFINDIAPANLDIFQMSAKEWVSQGIRLGGAIIMSVIATIALARKTGAQGFITVEDFFGGFVIGVLIAYEGVNYFDTLINGISAQHTVKPHS